MGNLALRNRFQSLTAEEIQEQEDKAWKELYKCRYLRIADEDVDLSGVNTLVKDQLAMINIFKVNKNVKKNPPLATRQFHNQRKIMVETETIIDLNA